jgi:hypothetical protein
MTGFDSANLRRALLLAVATAVGPLASGGQAVSASKSPPADSRVDLFGGYSDFQPVNSGVDGVYYLHIIQGADASAAAYFGKRFGIQAEGSFFLKGPHDNDCVYTAEAGPIFRFPAGRFVPFVHILGGGVEAGGPSLQLCTWGYGGTAGLGLDYVLPQARLRDHVAIRLIQADFAYSDVNYGARTPGLLNGGVGQVTAYRLSAGVVFRFGEPTPPEPAVYGCEVQPVSVYAGDPVHVTGNVLNLARGKHRTPTFTWSTTGGKIEGNTENATISTGGLAPGEYVVTGQVREGPHSTQYAECTALFRVSVCVATPSLTPEDKRACR